MASSHHPGPPGSSPRARGAVPAVAIHSGHQRFIPACAGSSDTRPVPCHECAVHPRVRREQRYRHLYQTRHTGSSPRARGAGEVKLGTAAGLRFIPACAGSRVATFPTPAPRPVHPRVHGEQRISPIWRSSIPGSSPRARGAVGSRRAYPSSKDFIPACAGSSGLYLVEAADNAVHPRVRGEQPYLPRATGTAGGSSPRARGAVALGEYLGL